MSTLSVVISGGQDGADIAGVRAAKKCGLVTGGCLPPNGMTKSGIMPLQTVELYNFHYFKSSTQLTPSQCYTLRTEQNVKNSDGTIRLAYNFDSLGEMATLKWIKKHKKPYLDRYIQFDY